MDDSQLEFSVQAFSKMVMHAMKYPHSMCCGLLLSPKLDEEDQDKGDADPMSIKIIDAIPISHASHCLAPNIEIAFNSVSIFAQEQELVISGYYQTERYLDSDGIELFSQKVAEKICENFPNAVLCLLKFDNIQASTLLNPHQMIDGRWKRKSPNSFSIEIDPEIIAENILYSKEKLYRKIIDFDDHFNNISLDWTNSSIGQKIDYLTANVC